MIAWFDCFAGASGDMILGALVDVGFPQERLLELPKALGLDGTEISCSKVVKNGIAGVQVRVDPVKYQELRTLPVIASLINASSLPAEVKERTLEIFHILAEAEAEVHGCRVDEVHFHEIGAVDTIIDIAGSVLALKELGISECQASPLPMGKGVVRCAHGTIPLPSPAVSRIVRGVPVYGVERAAETVTPTGAAILRGLCSSFGPMPAMAVEHTGYGAGEADFSEIPNLLRLWLGQDEIASMSPVTRLSTCIDDMNPEWFPHVMARLFDAGALDVFIRPVQMKKGRPGSEIVVLSPPGYEKRLSEVIFQETTTSGIRFVQESRYLLPRSSETVQSPWGRVKVKAITRPDGRRELVPEYEECRRIAEEQGIPLPKVYAAILKIT